jgi:hypothetical protein
MSSDLLGCIAQALQGRDWERLRGLYHPRSRFVLVSTDEVSLTITDHEFLDDHALCSEMQYKRSDGFIADEARAWIHVEKDGLIYRAVGFETPECAAAIYTRDGITLGIPE